jgi:hypothetical protein
MSLGHNGQYGAISVPRGRTNRADQKIQIRSFHFSGSSAALFQKLLDARDSIVTE